MGIRLICVDIDGTLIDVNAEISKQSKMKLKDMREKGYIIVLCSGRAMVDLDSFNEDFSLADYQIAFNGALIKNKDKVIFSEPINDKLIDYLLNWSKEKNVDPTFYTADSYYYGKSKLKQELQFANYLRMRNKSKTDFMKSKPIFVDDDRWKEVQKKFSEQVYKIEIVRTDESVEQCIEQLNEMKDLEISFFDGKIYEIMPHYELTSKSVNKYKAISKLEEYLGLSDQETAMIGDGDNDIVAIEHVSVGIAMGNAPERIKVKANFVTKSNLEEGVSVALDYICELNEK